MDEIVCRWDPEQAGMTDCVVSRSDLPILPRQGEVAPKVTEGGTRNKGFPYLPLRLASASHPPLAGEDSSQALAQRAGHQLVQTRV
jgi:hypothetical protein